MKEILDISTSVEDHSDSEAIEDLSELSESDTA
jgi:hypothetical protein